MIYNHYSSPRKSLDLRGEFFILLFFLLVSMLVFKRHFGKGNKKLKGENRKVKTTETRANIKTTCVGSNENVCAQFANCANYANSHFSQKSQFAQIAID